MASVHPASKDTDKLDPNTQLNLYSKHHSIKKSALYVLMEDFEKTDHEFFKNHHVEKMANPKPIRNHSMMNNRYLVHLTNRPIVNLYQHQGYECIRRHITIDEYYSSETSSKGASGFTYVHATEFYQKDAEHIIVHAFYSREGKFLFAQVKKSQAPSLKDKEDSDTPKVSKKSYVYLEVNPDLEERIKRNCFDASNIIHELIAHRATQYISAVGETNILLAQLEDISHNLENQKNIDEYIRIGEQFLQKVSEINRYCDGLIFDPRGNSNSSVAKHIAFLKMRHSAVASQMSSKASVVSTIISDSASPEEHTLENLDPHESTTSKHDNSVDPELQQKFKSIENRAKKLNDNDADLKSAIENYKLANTLSDEIFDLIISEYYVNAPKAMKAAIQNIETKASRICNGANNLFIRCLTSGSSQEFELVFEINPHRFTYESTYKLLFLICETRDRDLVQKLSVICQFLYKNSEVYRSFVLIADQITTDAFIPSKTILQSDLSLMLSLFTLAITTAHEMKDLRVCNLLLQHGYNPNGIGVYNVREKKYASIIRVALLYDKPDLITTLLKHGAILNLKKKWSEANYRVFEKHLKLPKDSIQFLGSPQPTVSRSRQPKTQDVSQSEFSSDNMSDLFSPTSDLYFASALTRYHTLSILANSSDLLDILNLLTEALNAPGALGFLAGVSQNSGLEFVPYDSAVVEQRRRDELMGSLTTTPKKAKLIVSYAAPEGESPANYNRLLSTLIPIFNARCQDRPEIIEATIAGQEAILKTNVDKGTKIDLYNSCIYLLLEKQNLTYMDVQKLMLYFYHTGTLVLEENDPRCTGAFERLLQLVVASPLFCDKLKETPTFKGAIRKIESSEHLCGNRHILAHLSSLKVELKPRFVAPALVFSSAVSSRTSQTDEKKKENKKKNKKK